MCSGKFLHGLLKKCFKDVAVNNRYDLPDFLTVLLEVAHTNGFLEGTCKVVSGACDAETLFNRLNDVDYRALLNCFQEDVLKSLPAIKAGTRNRKMVLAADLTHESYYGNHPNIWVHKKKYDKGATGSYQILVLSVLVGTRREIIGLLPLKRGDNACELLIQLLDDLKQKLHIDGLLLDRGFDSKWLIRELKHRRIRFLLLWRKAEYHRQIFKDMGKSKWKRIRHGLPLNGKDVTFTLVFVKSIKIKGDKKAYTWVYATNMRKSKPIHYILQYKKRWGIETLFRVLDEQRIKTKTKNITKRLFLMLVTIYLYNTWKQVLSLLEYHVTFTEYATHIQHILEQMHPPKPPTPRQVQTQQDIQTLLEII